MPYATGDDFLKRYDARLIGDLVSDEGTKVPAADLPSNAVLLAALTDASAAIDAAVSVGNRYTPAQMANLADTAAGFVRRLVCDLALIYIKRRRGRFDADKDSALLKEVNGSIDSLRKGDDLLLLADQSQAPASTVELVQPEIIPIRRPDTIRNRTRNYYPRGPHGRSDDCANH